MTKKLTKIPPGPRKRYAKEAEAPTAWEKSYFWPRLVAPALKPSEHVLLDVCMAPGRFSRMAVTRRVERFDW